MSKDNTVKAEKDTKHRPTRLGIEERRNRVSKLMIQGFTPSEILQQLGSEFQGLTKKTVENDIGVINAQLKQAVTTIDLEGEIGKMLASYSELERVEWESILSANTSKEKTAGVKALSEILSARAKLLERAGLLVPVQRIVQENGDTWEGMIRKLRESRGLEQLDEEAAITPLNEWMSN